MSVVDVMWPAGAASGGQRDTCLTDVASFECLTCDLS